MSAPAGGFPVAGPGGGAQLPLCVTAFASPHFFLHARITTPALWSLTLLVRGV